MWRRALASVLVLTLWPSIALAQTWAPGPQAVGSSTVVGFIDSPKADAAFKVGDKVSLYGWVIDNTASGWTGIDEVHVYRGTSADTFLGRASYGVERRDVSNHFANEGWRNSGFALAIDTANFGVGPTTLTVYAHTPLRGWWANSVIVNLTREAAVADRAELMTWKTPRNHTVRTVESLTKPLELLAQTAWGGWALDLVGDRGLTVLWSGELGNRFSLYQYGARIIYVNASHRNAQPHAIAAAVAHELQHAVDDVFGWATWRAISCLDLASRSFLSQAATWNSFYGPFGKVQALDPLEEAHNAVLSAITARHATWLDEAIAKYRSPCA